MVSEIQGMFPGAVNTDMVKAVYRTEDEVELDVLE